MTVNQPSEMCRKVVGLDIFSRYLRSVPSHFFMVLSRCPGSVPSCGSPTTLSFILPHIERNADCQVRKKYTI